MVASDSPVNSDICGVLPEEGACSLLCDVDALVATFVPEGTCVAFICDLTDGQTIAMHVCHPSQSHRSPSVHETS